MSERLVRIFADDDRKLTDVDEVYLYLFLWYTYPGFISIFTSSQASDGSIYRTSRRDESIIHIGYQNNDLPII